MQLVEAGTIELESLSADDSRGLSAGLAYGSRESIDAFAGIGVPLGRGQLTASSAWMPITASISAFTFSMSAVGRSILLSTGTTSRPCSTAV